MLVAWIRRGGFVCCYGRHAAFADKPIWYLDDLFFVDNVAGELAVDAAVSHNHDGWPDDLLQSLEERMIDFPSAASAANDVDLLLGADVDMPLVHDDDLDRIPSVRPASASAGCRPRADRPTEASRARMSNRLTARSSASASLEGSTRKPLTWS